MDPPLTPRLGDLRVAADPATLVEEVAADFLRRARHGSEESGTFRVALSGGSTPLALFRRLADSAGDPSIRWESSAWFWGDERCVPPAHPESNFRAAHDALLSHLPVPPERVHRIRAELAPEESAAAYEDELRRAFGLAAGEIPRFDLVLLGLGADGHTASLFPGTAALAERERLAVANWVPKLGAHRITLTYPVLNRAACVIFLVAGADKAAALDRVLHTEPDPELLPAQGVQPTDGELIWWVDRAALGRKDGFLLSRE